jgi:tRNA pseudouridine38-40 synthase
VGAFRLEVEYEGTRYRGWQEQKNARTVAGELRRACEEALGAPVELGGAGRTDAGVHALGQVAHLKCRASARPSQLVGEINDRLPPDIHVRRLEPALERFHARHDAVSRSYLYQISRRRTALAKRFVWWVKRPLDEAAMARGAARLAGRHDFAAFTEKPDAQTSTLVVVESCEVRAEGELVLFRIVASHFLWKMVRRLTGALVELGAGTLDERGLERLLAGGVVEAGPRPAEWTAPPSGLFLERVVYPDEPPLAALRAVTPLD